MAKCIMIQGTMSSAGKSFLVAGLCRILKQDGYKVAPFKSQNMALNSFITEDGLEMGRAQVMQAEACGILPTVYMNPILLKPTNDIGSQIIVNGKVMGNMSARDYFRYKQQLIPEIKKAFETLEESYDVIVIEGAGSPAEINLKENDIVNMGLAKILDAPVLLAGDIDRGGVFAQLYGTYELLDLEEKNRIKGLIINKFRGDKSILDPGIEMIEAKMPVKVVGVVPYMNVHVDDEDSLTTRFDKKKEKLIDIAVIRFPRISNFTDFNVFEQMEGVSVRYVTGVEELHQPDMIILPGSKNTIEDLLWMRQNGIEAAVKKKSGEIPIWGICGGYQMLGDTIADELEVEQGGIVRGMELLPVDTKMQAEKKTVQVKGRFEKISGIFSKLNGLQISGYEIHMGKSVEKQDSHISRLNDGDTDYVAGSQNGMIYGSYVHGIFDEGNIAPKIVKILAKRKGIEIDTDQWMNYKEFKESQYDKMADILREHLDMDSIYKILDDNNYDQSTENESHFTAKKNNLFAEIQYKNTSEIQITPPNQTMQSQIEDIWDQIVKPLKSLGEFEKIIAKIGAIQMTKHPRISRREILVFCSDNGVVEEGISQSGQEVTRIITENMGKQNSSVCFMGKQANVSIYPVDIGMVGKEELKGVRNLKVCEGTKNFAIEPAMSREQMWQAITTGIALVRQKKREGVDLLAIGEMGIGNTTTSSAVAASLLRLPAEKTTGRGAGLSNSGLEKKIQVIGEAIAKYHLYDCSAEEILMTVGGFDIAAMTGACIGGAIYKIPVVLDGVISTVAALLAERMCPGVRDYLIASHRSKEPAAKLMEEELNLHPVIDAKLALGEGTGTTFFFAMLDVALAEYEGQAKFEDYHMEQYEDYQNQEDSCV